MTVNCNRHLLTQFADQAAVQSRLPKDWPYRQASHLVTVGPLSWHFQFHAAKNNSLLTLVLLHGTGSSTHSWADLIEPLSEFACVLAIDLPGHGFTYGADPQSLTLPKMAQSLHALLQALRIEGPLVFVGHSAGAPLAIEWALGHIQDKTLAFQVTQIIGLNPSLVPPPLLYTTLLGPMVAPIATSNPMTGMLAFIAANTGMVDQLLDSTGSKIPQTHRKNYRYLFSQANHVQGAVGFMAGADLPSILERGRTLKVPCSFLIGAADTWVKEAPLKEIIRNSFPDAAVITWPGGHLLHEENPKETAALIRKFVTPTSA